MDSNNARVFLGAGECRNGRSRGMMWVKRALATEGRGAAVEVGFMLVLLSPNPFRSARLSREDLPL